MKAVMTLEKNNAVVEIELFENLIQSILSALIELYNSGIFSTFSNFRFEDINITLLYLFKSKYFVTKYFKWYKW